jgi:hypothetical protein
MCAYQPEFLKTGLQRILVSILIPVSVALLGACASDANARRSEPGASGAVPNRVEEPLALETEPPPAPTAIRAARRPMFTLDDRSLRDFAATLTSAVWWMLEQGHADYLRRSDLFHAHLGLDAQGLSAVGAAATHAEAERALVRNAWLLIHSRERPHEIREIWMAELERIGGRSISSWVQYLRETDFDYESFRSNPRASESREPLSIARIERLSRLWHRELLEAGPLEARAFNPGRTAPRIAELQLSRRPDRSELAERVIFLHGATQPGYEEAVNELFGNRSFLIRASGDEAFADAWEGRPRLAAVFPEGFYEVATIYFGPRPANGSPGPREQGVLIPETSAYARTVQTALDDPNLRSVAPPRLPDRILLGKNLAFGVLFAGEDS